MDGKKFEAFIPDLFKCKKIKVKADDPFVNEVALQDYSSIFSPDGIPNNIRGDPYLAEIINFSEESLNDIAQFQVQREQREREAIALKEKKRKQEEVVEQKIRKSLDSEVDKIFQEKAFFLKKQCPVKIPYKSSLSHDEHEAYLRAFLKFRMRPARSAEAAEYENYLRLQHRVYEEQKNFMEFSHQVARLELETYNTVPEEITRFIDGYVQHRSKRAAKYQKHYVNEQQVPIRPQDPEKHFTSLSFSHLGHLLSVGTLPRFIVPNKLQLHTLEIDDSISEKDLMAQSVAPSEDILGNTPVSADRNAEYLAQHHRANIVISPSAMKVLADNHGPNYEKEWDIPVEIKSYAVKDLDGRNTQHRVVYIDKPMPKKTWTSLEKKQLYFKKAILAKFSQINQKKLFDLKTPYIFQCPRKDESVADENSRLLVEYDDPFMEFSSMGDSDVFGDESVKSEKIKETRKRKTKNNKINKSTVKASKLEVDMLNVSQNNVESSEKFLNINAEEAILNNVLKKTEEAFEGEHRTDVSESVGDLCSSKTSSIEKTPVDMDSVPEKTSQSDTNQKDSNVNSKNFLENLLTMQNLLLKPLQTVSETVEVNKDNKTWSPDKLRPWTHQLHTNWKNFTKPHICPKWTGKNIHYQLFSLESNTSGSLQPLRVLVRSNLHGLSYFSADKKKSKTYIAYPKVESQAYFGCEVNTLSEITQQWVQLLVRPTTWLFHVRVCERSGEILMTEERDLSTILKEGKQLHVGFSPHQPLATFYSVFSAVLGQPSGHYLLHHDPKTKAFIHLMKALNPNREANLHTYNLHKAYDKPSVNTRMYSVPPWLAIDTYVLSPFHLHHKKIPGTFPMSKPSKGVFMKKKKKVNNKKKTLQDLDKEKKEELNVF